MKKVLFSLLAAAALFASCTKEDAVILPASTQGVTITACLASDTKVYYPSVIDSATATIVVQVPYYISDTEPIMGNIKEMKINATLPVGAKFEPTIAGVKNLDPADGGFKTTLVISDKCKTEFTITAAYVKSSAAVLKDVKPVSGSASVVVSQPASAGEKGKMMTLSSSINSLKKTKLIMSPWATAEGESVTYDKEANIYYYDMSRQADVTVVSQDGTVKTTYCTSFETPETVEYGVGHIESLWAWQCTQEHSHGFERDCNRTMAVTDDYVIVSSSDWNKETSEGILKDMLVFDRYTGEDAAVKVNQEGIATNVEIRAIATDDANHLVGMTFACKESMEYFDSVKASNPGTANLVGRNFYRTPSQVSQIWIWKDGIESAPTKLFEFGISGTEADWLRAQVANQPEKLRFYPEMVGNTIKVMGDLTSGDAALTFINCHSTRVDVLIFKDGNCEKLIVEAPMIGDAPQYVGDWYCAAAIPVKLSENWVDYYYVSGYESRKVIYAKESSYVDFTLPTVNFWQTEKYAHIIKSCDFIQFNGANLLAVQNETMANSNHASRLYISDVSAEPTSESFAQGFLFDSRENNGCPLGEIAGTGPYVTGMTSMVSYESGETPIGTANHYFKNGDVVFAPTMDPNEVDVYLMSMNCGIFAYKLSAYKQ